MVTVNCPSNETVDPTTNTCSCPTGQHYVASGNDGNKWVAWGANGHIYLAPYPVPSYTYSGLTFYVYDPVRQIKSVKVADFEANPENYINHATPVPVEKKSGGRFVFNVALLASENSTTQARVIDNLKSNIGNPYLCTSNAIGAKPCHSNNDGVLTPAFSYTSGGQMYGANTDSDGSVGYGKTSTIGVFSDAVAGGACVLDDSNLCPDGSSPVDGNCPNSDTQICPDGSVISSTDTCPGGDTQTCPDGSVISISDTCPTPQSCDTSSDCTDGKTCQDTICSFPPNTPDTDPTKNSNGSKKGSVVLDSLKVVPNTINPADGTTANPGNCNLVWVVSQHDSGSVCTLYGGGLDSSNPIDLDKGIVTSGVTTGTITDSGIKNETTYHVTCDETSTDPITKSVTVTASSTKYATCNINAGFVETNH